MVLYLLRRSNTILLLCKVIFVVFSSFCVILDTENLVIALFCLCKSGFFATRNQPSLIWGMSLCKHRLHRELTRRARDMHLPSRLLVSQGYGGMAPVSGVLEWSDTGSLGRLGREDQVRIKRRAWTGDIIVGISYRLADQEVQADETFCRQTGAALHSQTLILMGTSTTLIICWRNNTAGHKQSRSFLECVDDTSLTK